MTNGTPLMHLYRQRVLILAAPIYYYERQADGGLRYSLGDGVPHSISREVAKRFYPTEQDKGYVVRHPDGYTGWYPTATFLALYESASQYTGTYNGVPIGVTTKGT